METFVEWSVKIGKEAFIKHWKNPRTIFAIIISFICLYILGNMLAIILEDKLSIPRFVTAFGVVLLFILIVISTYRANKDLLKEGIRNYKIDSFGVTINGELHAWSKYKYFLDNFNLFRDEASRLPSTVDALASVITSLQPTERWTISLTQSKYSDKNAVLLVMDNIDIYNRVRDVVKGKLEEITL